MNKPSQQSSSSNIRLTHRILSARELPMSLWAGQQRKPRWCAASILSMLSLPAPSIARAIALGQGNCLTFPLFALYQQIHWPSIWPPTSITTGPPPASPWGARLVPCCVINKQRVIANKLYFVFLNILFNILIHCSYSFFCWITPPHAWPPHLITHREIPADNLIKNSINFGFSPCLLRILLPPTHCFTAEPNHNWTPHKIYTKHKITGNPLNRMNSRRPV